MRILIITQWFDPEPHSKGLSFAQELRRQGHEVEILTGFPNYPGGKLYPGYRVRPFQREHMDGIPVLRVPLYPSHDQSGVRRALNYVSFAAAASIGSLFVTRPDVAYVYHPPATVGLPAMVLQALRGVPFVYDIQDLWPDTLAATGMMQNAAVLKAVGGWMTQIYRQANHITVLSEGFKKRLIERGVPSTKLSVIRNWADESQIKLTKRDSQRARELGFENRFNVVFAGTMGKAQALDTVLDTAQILQETHPTARFVLIGGGVEVTRLQAQAKNRLLSNVEFMPRRPPAEIGEILGLADTLLVHLKDDELFTITIPSKIQAYLMAGKPVLVGVRGDAARMVEDAAAGYTFEPQNPQALADAVRRMMSLTSEERDQMGAAGQDYYYANLSLEVGVQQFLRVFEQLARQNRPPDMSKRLFDIFAAGAGLVLLSVPLAALSLLVRLNLGSPVLFQQERPGLDGKPFTMYKLRTMLDTTDPDGGLLPNHQRLTPFGKFLRSTSLDELPELFNVLKGDMSIVGPRPLLMEYLSRYSPEQSRRHEVRPGITGWAQINGRNSISWKDKFELDVWYVDNMSLGLDLRIILLTLLKVFKRENINSSGTVTMTKFTGNGIVDGHESSSG